MADFPAPAEGILVTLFLTVRDVPRSRDFYGRILGGTSTFMNLRVADIHARYAEWTARGAEFLTPPIDRGAEIRCYVRDPDGYLIEVGQSTGVIRK
jgi:catechol 2,3-dioxygenase-like lactoylglutathione lyase family enzyme